MTDGCVLNILKVTCDMSDTVGSLVVGIQTLDPDSHLNSFVLSQAEAYGIIWHGETTILSAQIRI